MSKQYSPQRIRGTSVSEILGSHEAWSGRCFVALLCLLAALLVNTSATAQESGTRLGSPEVLSSLGSPLTVRIPILNPTEDTSALRFGIGAPADRLGVPFIDSAKLGIERAGGKTFLLLQARSSNYEPAIGFVVREQLEGGVRSREFIVLVDPPGMSVAQQALPDVVPPPIGTESLTAIARPERDPDAIFTPAPPPAPARTSVVTTDGVGEAAPQRPRRVRPPRPAALDEAAPASRSERVAKARTGPAREARPSRTRGSAGTAAGGEGVLKLSTSPSLATDAPISEEERSRLRDRQLLLDVDDRTSELLDQRFKITRLEKQLASIQARIEDAERRLAASGVAIAAAPAATSAPAVAPVVAAPTRPPGAVSIPKIAERPTPPAVASPMTLPPALEGVWAWLKTNWLAVLAGLAALLALILGGRFAWQRQAERAASRSVLYVPEDATAAKRPASTGANKSTEWASATWQMKKPPDAAMMPAATAAATVGAVEPALTPAPGAAPPRTTQAIPNSFWDDDGIGGDKSDDADSVDTLFFDETDVERAPDFPISVVAGPTSKPGERSRELYLRHRYPEIAMLNPALDDEKSLISRAVTLYDEGAADFAKRLLKYAAYQRPINDRYWLALLELLFREKLAHEYVVNAKWFHHHLPLAKEWPEVVRMGFILSPRDHLFLPAATESHEDPPLGRWFPVGGLPSISLDLPSLKLELAS